MQDVNNGPLELLKNGTNTKDELLYLFSLYVATHPDFKYNISYLTDLIQPFLECKAKYKEKITVFTQVSELAKESCKNEFEFILYFDDKFKFNTMLSNSLEVITNSDFPPIYDIGSKVFPLKLVSEIMSIEYTHLIEMDEAVKKCIACIDSFISILEKNMYEK